MENNTLFIKKILSVVFSVLFLIHLMGCKPAFIKEKFSQKDLVDVENDTVGILRVVDETEDNTGIILALRKLDYRGALVTFKKNKWGESTIANNGEYFVFKFEGPLKEREHVLIDNISYYGDKNVSLYVKGDSLSGYGGCSAQELFGFRLDKPGVYDLGKLELKTTDSGLKFKLSENAVETKEFLENKYPNINADNIESSLIRLFPVDRVCVNYVTIYI